MDYRLKRSKRKSVGIYITKQAEVEVRAPLHCPVEWIDAFVSSRMDWILEHQQQARQRVEARQNFSIQFGDTVLYLGKKYTILPGQDSRLEGEKLLFPDNGRKDLRPALFMWYRNMAGKRIPERVEYYQKLTGWTASAVKISAAYARWGSCSGKNSLNFSWRLIMVPLEALDYVVVHELAHTVEHNHSKSFWHLVETILPDYQKRQKMLRVWEKQLALQNWEEIQTMPR